MRVYRHPRRPREVLAFTPEVHRADEEAAVVALGRVESRRHPARDGWTEQTRGRSAPQARSTPQLLSV